MKHTMSYQAIRRRLLAEGIDPEILASYEAEVRASIAGRDDINNRHNYAQKALANARNRACKVETRPLGMLGLGDDDRPCRVSYDTVGDGETLKSEAIAADTMAQLHQLRDSLSDLEAQILDAVATGHTVREIADALGKSVQWVQLIIRGIRERATQYV